MIKVTEPGLAFYVDKLNLSEHFSFVRYGDGEWSAIVRNRKSCLGQSVVLPGLKEAMINSIKNAPNDSHYLMASHPNQSQGNIESWLKSNQPKWLKWLDNRTFYKASMHGELFSFVEALRNLTSPVVFIGPKHLRKMSSHLRVDHFIEISGTDCFVDFDKTLKQVRDFGPAFYSVSAGLASSPLVWAMHKYLLGGWILDLGSLWDIYCGKWSRSYHSRVDIKRNLWNQ